MEPSSEYWTLHEWLFKAYISGLQDGYEARKPFIMCALFGPDWQQKEQEMAAEMMAEMIAQEPALQQHILAQMEA